MAPYMAAPGNHEHVPGTLINGTGRYPSDFAAFSARYTMPGACVVGVVGVVRSAG